MRWCKPWMAALSAVPVKLPLASLFGLVLAVAAAGSGTPDAPGSIAATVGCASAGLALQGKPYGSSHHQVLLQLQGGPSPSRTFATAHGFQVDDDKRRVNHDAVLSALNRDHVG